MGGQDVLADAERPGAVRHAVLKRDNLQIGEFLGERFLESFLAGDGRSSAGYHRNNRHLSAAIQYFRQPPRGQDPAPIVIRSHEGNVIAGVRAGIYNGEGDVGLTRAGDDRDQSIFVRWRKLDPIHLTVDEIIDNGNLARVVRLLGWAVPINIHSGFLGGGGRSGMHGLPENVSLPLGDYRVERTLAPVAAGEREGNGPECPHGHQRCPTSGQSGVVESASHLSASTPLMYSGRAKSVSKARWISSSA